MRSRARSVGTVGGIAVLLVVVAGSLIAPRALAARGGGMHGASGLSVQAVLYSNEWGDSWGTWTSDGVIVDSGTCGLHMSPYPDSWDVVLEGQTWRITVSWYLPTGTASFVAQNYGTSETLEGRGTVSWKNLGKHGEYGPYQFGFKGSVVDSP
jgi:hypothetical protein